MRRFWVVPPSPFAPRGLSWGGSHDTLGEVEPSSLPILLSRINPYMTKKTKTPNAIDAEGNLVTLSAEEVRLQTEFLDSLPKDQQIKLAADAAGMSVVELLVQIAKLHMTMEEGEQGLFDYMGVPCAEPIQFEFIDPKKTKTKR